MSALELVDLSKSYGSVRAVERVSLSVPEGSLFGLIGPNGAGKTTTFGMIAGFLRPDAGEIRVRGVAIGPGQPRAGKVVALPQDADLPSHQKVIEVLTMLGRFSGLAKREAEARSMHALERLGMAEHATRKLEQLSHGQRRRVGIAQTLLGDDEVILLDEPTAGLDPQVAGELRALIRELGGKKTIVLSSHNLAEVEALCDHAAILNKGALVISASMAEIKGSGAMAQVRLSAPVTDGSLIDDLAVITGVESARLLPEGKAIDLVFSEQDEAKRDDVINEVLAKLIAKGAKIQSVERGRSLEERFLEKVRSD